MIALDSFYTIGKTHLVCEDYVLHDTLPFPWAALSDGCSSSEHSDVGARLLAWAARQQIMQDSTNLDDYQGFGQSVLRAAHQALKQLDLPDSALDATLMLAWRNAQSICVMVYGDGVILLRRVDGEMESIQIEYVHNAPFYLSYQLEEARIDNYRTYDPKPLRIIDSRETQQQPSLDFAMPLEFQFDLSDYSVVAIASDGIAQLYQAEKNQMLDLQNVIPSFLVLQNLTGEFVKRRVLRALQQFAKHDVMPADDLSLAIFAQEQKNT